MLFQAAHFSLESYQQLSHSILFQYFVTVCLKSTRIHIETHITVIGTDLLLVPEESVQVPCLLSVIHVVTPVLDVVGNALGEDTQNKFRVDILLQFSPVLQQTGSLPTWRTCAKSQFTLQRITARAPTQRGLEARNCLRGHCCSSGENKIVFRERQLVITMSLFTV